MKRSLGLSLAVWKSILTTMTIIMMQQSTTASAFFLAPLQRAALKNDLQNACTKEKENTPRILELVEELKKLNPSTDIRKDFNKLDGNWKLDFTTAPAQEVPREEEEKDGNIVKTYQSIDTKEGVIYNIIDRGLPEKGLKIAVGAEPTRSDRVALDFRTIEAMNDRFPRKVTLRFPPRDFFRAITKISKFLTQEPYDELEFKELAYFDVLFLDDTLRIQRNSEGNIFVNSRIK